MERINLNVPREVRQRLRAMAARLGQSEARTARELLLHGLGRAERDAFYARVGSAMTPAVRQRMLAIHDALDGLDG